MKRCSFTGHRPEKLINVTIGLQELKVRLEEAINFVMTQNVNIFYTGMARGVDLWAAEIVLKKKLTRKDIRLVAVLPFPEQINDTWTSAEQTLYQNILKQCDEVITICTSYQKNGYKKRNRYLVEHADILLAVYNKQYQYSGTGQTVRMAEKAGKEIVFLDF